MKRCLLSFLCLMLILPTFVTSTYAATERQYNYDIYGVKNGTSCYEGKDIFVRRYEAATTTTVFQEYKFGGCSYQMVGEIYDLYGTGYNRTTSGDGMKYFVKTGGWVEEYLRPVAYNKVRGAKIMSTVAPNGTYPDDGIHTDGYWYVKTSMVPNAPVLSITSSGNKTINLKQGQDTFTLTGTVADTYNETLTVSATIGGLTKQVTASNAGLTAKNWTLTWRTSEFNASGTYTGITVKVDDGNSGTATATYAGSLAVNKTALYYWDKYSVRQNPVYNLTWSAYNGGSDTVSLENAATYYTKYNFDSNTGRAYVDSDSAVSGFEAKSQFLPEVYKSYGSDGVFKYTKASSGSTGTKYWQYNSSTNITGSVPVKDQLLQSNLLELDGTYPDNGVHTDGYWYVKKSTTNMFPVIIVDNSDVVVSQSTSKITLSGTASDADGDKISITATLAGVAKSTSVAGSGTWKLEWTVAEVPDGFYTVIPIKGSDGKEGLDTITYSGTITVDTTGPDKPALTITPSGEWSKETVTVTLTPGVDDGVGTEKTQYKLSDGSWEDYKGPIILEAEGIHELKAVSIDKLGNVGSELQQMIRIDKTLPGRPDVVLSNDEWTNQDVTLYVMHGSDTGSGVDYSTYSRDGVNWTNYTGPVVEKESGEWIYQFYTVDKAGNKGDPSQVVVKIDKQAPTAPEMSLSHSGYTQDAVRVQIADGRDDLSGVARTEVKVGAGNWKTYADDTVIDEEGLTDVWARTIDAAGNISPEAHAQVMIDRTEPTEPSYSLTENQWTNNDVTFTLGGSQDESNVHYEYKIDASPYTMGDSGTISQSGEHVITARAIDEVGLASPEIEFKVRIDKEVPEVVLTPNGSEWSSQASNIQVAATDGLSGVADPIYYEVSQNPNAAGAWQVLPGNGQVDIMDEGTWYVHTRVTDLAGNTETYTSNPYQLQQAPDAPAVHAEALSATEVRLRWNLPSNRYTDGYTYTVKNLNTGAETKVNYPVNEFIDRNLEGGQTYAYQLQVNNHVGSAESRTEALTYPNSPEATVTPVYRTPGEMTVTIDPVQSAIEYRLVLIDNQGQTRQDDRITGTHHTLTGLSPGSQYTIQVSALNSSGESVATSTGFLTLPARPTGFTAVEIREDSIKTQWQSVTTATYYDLYRDDNLLFNGGEQDLNYMDSGLNAGTAYAYAIAAGNDTGEGEVSDTLDLMTLPAQDNSLRMHSYNTNGFTAQWDGVQGASSYLLQVSDLNGLIVADYQGTNLQYEVTGLEAGTEYSISLVAINISGQGKAKVLRTLTLPERVGSAHVTGIEETEAELQLSAVTGATYYKIELNDGVQFTTTDLNFVMTQLQGSKVYTGTVQAVNGSGSSAPLEFEFTTKPVRPSSLQVKSVGQTEMSLSWSDDVTAVRYWMTDEKGNKLDVTEAGITISDLQPGTEYHFQIQTENATGLGKASEIVWSTRTERPDLLQTDVQYTEASLSWSEPYGAAEYLIKDEATGQVYYSGSQDSVHLTQLEAGKVYDLTLYAINKTGDASQGTQVQLVTLAKMSNLNAKITDVTAKAITIELQKAGQAIDEYVILRDNREIAKVNAAEQVVYNDTDVLPGTDYVYEVIPVNKGGSGKGVQLKTTTATNPVSLEELQVEVGDNWAEIRFPEVDHASEYVVIDQEGSEIWRGDTLPIRMDGLEPGTAYPVKIVAENTEGTPSVAVPVEFWTLPLAPQPIKATSTTNTITLDFKAVSTKGFTHLVIYRDNKEVGRVKADESYFVEPGLKANTTYEYQVKAFNPSGLSLEAETIKISTQASSHVIGSGGSGAGSAGEGIEQNTNNDQIEEKPSTEDQPGQEPAPDSNQFSDITTNFAKAEIESLAKDGIIKGIKFDIFAPDQPITRMEFAALIVRTLAASPDDTVRLTFEDINQEAWYTSELNAAIANGIAKGFSRTEFRPTALINREQASKMLMNVLIKEGAVSTGAANNKFSDENSIAVWAIEDVKMASEQNMVQGYPDGTFRPKNSLTRAEAAALVYRLRESIIN